MGCMYANRGLHLGETLWDFDGQEIFRRAVKGMTQASAKVLAKGGISAADIDLVVPHQANLRIIESVAKHVGVPMDKVHLTVERYGNMSAATVPVALVDALEAGRVKPGSLLLMPGFGAGLTWCAHLVRWGDRVTPLAASDAELPVCDKTALQLINEIRALKDGQKTAHTLLNSRFVEALVS
jgi:3-oxoacyl-[acyl-carrier-protein] synthase III